MRILAQTRTTRSCPACSASVDDHTSTGGCTDPQCRGTRGNVDGRGCPCTPPLDLRPAEPRLLPLLRERTFGPAMPRTLGERVTDQQFAELLRRAGAVLVADEYLQVIAGATWTSEVLPGPILLSSGTGYGKSRGLQLVDAVTR